jgi:hypothetical protein
MLTLLQWQNTRRVDHANLGKFHPRFRAFDPNRRPNLKTFDDLVQRYETSTKDFDRVNILGDILGAAATFLADNKYEAHRYLDAVRTLRTAAIGELRDKFPKKGIEIANDIESVAKGRTLSSKEIHINVYYLDQVGATPDLNGVEKIIKDQIDNANNSGSFQNAELQIVRTNAKAALISTAANNRPVLHEGKLHEGGLGGGLLIEALNAIPGEGVDVVFLEKYEKDDVQGYTFQMSKEWDNSVNPKHQSTISPARPIVTVRTTAVAGGNKTHSTTLMHEICHAVSGNGDHSQDGDNLMADGGERAKKGVKNDLSLGQIGWYRNNDRVKDKGKG